jgi:hypothetical protein
MSFIEDLPQAHFGSVNDKPVDWRASADEDEIDENAPASDDLIAMLGFNPDEYEEESTKDSILVGIRDEIASIKAEFAKQKATETPQVETPDPPVNASNTGGIVYKGHSIKQDLDGSFNVLSVGGALIARVESLELAMSRINEISIVGSE